MKTLLVAQMGVTGVAFLALAAISLWLWRRFGVWGALVFALALTALGSLTLGTGVGIWLAP